ncbi:MAG: alpha-hydroxy-acid oxidizing protein [Proteobacteria bacterium]|nr:alpha-hydroxy-acid oxidizing protein [Pseudomonadota bacterium]
MSSLDPASVAGLDDLRRLARRRLPRLLFDYIDGGAGDDAGVRHNRAAFAAYRLRPRYLVDVSQRDTSTTLWGRRYSMPVGIAPVGLVGLFRANGESLLARAAQQADVPYVLSGASIASIEEAAQAAPRHTWYQLYPAREPRVSLDLVHRAAQAQIEVLVLTVDLPVPARRHRDIRNRFDYNVRLTPALLLDGLRHPAWTLEYLRHGGLPSFGSWARYTRPGASAREVGEYFVAQSYVTQTWRDVEAYRRAWPGRLVIKGIQHPDDARRAATLGVDGVIVSNHGGRQLDCLPSALVVLPEIRAAAGTDMVVMADGGVRSGSDVAIALCRGADFVFVGRPPVYGVAAAGQAGAARALEILREEFDLVLGQLGLANARELEPALLVPAGHAAGGPL